jgi:hypothetical protein
MEKPEEFTNLSLREIWKFMKRYSYHGTESDFRSTMDYVTGVSASGPTGARTLHSFVHSFICSLTPSFITDCILFV